MFNNIDLSWFKHFLGIFIVYAVLSGLVIFVFVQDNKAYEWLICAPIVGFVAAAILTISHIKNEAQREINAHKAITENQIRQTEEAIKESNIWKQSLIEKSQGFPTLLREIDRLIELKQDEPIVAFLRRKSHPAFKAAQIVRDEARKRREAVFQQKNTQAIIEYYENIAPFLVDLRNDVEGIDETTRFENYSDEEFEDPVTQYLAKEEYRKLSSAERNQMALDRYWHRPKSNWELGRWYERYVGYIYENEGYDVDYVGIYKGNEDLGRDLICTKANRVIVIQCKNWSQFKTIYEKHIFQFFGTVFQFRDENPGKDITPIFYTTTSVSTLAKRFADELKIELRENFKFNKMYPAIKCNISRSSGQKIYHLPFDQQYDHVKIEKEKGEFYCATTLEAEYKGFRRAFRYHSKSA